MPHLPTELPPLLPPLSLYIHIPWCVRKCPYCDFNSHEASKDSALPVTEYLEALESDLEESARFAQGRKLESIFFGGGTPSILDSNAIGQCIEMANNIVGIDVDAEITMEANPGTFEQKKFSGFRNAGVNRLSIGIQSLDSSQLKTLGRIHSADEAEAAVEMARDAGFGNINLDIMYGLPHQSNDDAMADLQKLIALDPEHISWYELTIEPNTEFYRRPPPQPVDDQLADISEAGIAILAEAGYQRYEISAFAKPGKECAHNLNYWEFGDYLGIGAGAHEKVTLLNDQRIVRRSRTRMPNHFIERIGSRVASENEIAKSDLPFEFCMNALRLTQGIEAINLEARTGLSLEELKKRLAQPISDNLVDVSQTRISPTHLGIKHLNTLLQSLLS